MNTNLQVVGLAPKPMVGTGGETFYACACEDFLGIAEAILPSSNFVKSPV